MLLNIFTGSAPTPKSTSASKPSRGPTSSSSAGAEKASSSTTTSSSTTATTATTTAAKKSKATTGPAPSTLHKSASALKYAERRQSEYQNRLEHKYGDRYHGNRPKRDEGEDGIKHGMGRDRDRKYGNNAAETAVAVAGLGGKTGKKEFNARGKHTRQAGAAPNTKATGFGGAEEALPITNLHDNKAQLLTKEEKIKEQRIGQDTALLTPKTPFEALGLDSELCDYLDAIQFSQPTKIQAQAIPALLGGRDALIQAQTGSGKTLCYLLPVLHQLQSPKIRLTRDDGTQAIILAPTRELAIQIEEVWKQVGKPYYWLIATTIMGGAKKKSEKSRLRKGCHVVIGTPGRIVDHLGSTQSWMLGNVNWFILDEADRLFDLGFRDAIRDIYTELIDRADNRPRCALISATLSKKQIRDNIFELSSLLLQDPVSIGFDGVVEINEDEEEEDDDDEVDREDNDKKAKKRDTKNNDDDDEGDYRRGTAVKAQKKRSHNSDSDSDDNESESDHNMNDIESEDEGALQTQLLFKTLGNNKKPLLTQTKTTLNNDSSSSSDDGDSSEDERDPTDLSSFVNPPPSIALPRSSTTGALIGEDKLLPRFKEKSMDHLQGLSKFATNEETEEALQSVTTSFATPSTLEQLYVKMSSRHRLVALASFLRLRIFNAQQQDKKCKMIVFVSTCASVEFLHKIFQHAYWPDDSVNLTGKYIDDNNAASSIYNYNTKPGTDSVSSGSKSSALQSQITSNIALAPKLQQAQDASVKQALINTQLWKLHGNMPQELRTQTYKRFCDATEGILFSTDVAARGLDLPLIDWIVQYDPPEDTEDYVHRIGRTARIGHSGRAILFLLESEEGYLQVLKKQGAELKQIPLATLLSGLHVDLPSKSLLLNQNKPLGAILQKQFEKLTTISTHLNTLAKASYIAFVRAYAAYPKTLKGIFHPRRLHLGEVAHSFALTETPSEITKHSREILRIAEATINPMKAAKDTEAVESKKRREEHKKSLTRIAAVSEKRQQMAEFL